MKEKTRKFLKSKNRFIILLFLYLMFPRKACAYLDPGTGSYFIQIIIATLIGTSFSVKVFWKDIKTFLKKSFSKKEGSEKNDKQ
ncbi:MAG: hypothetical protein WC845_00110 [Candidatus Staskawiczbacteria bacterium]|jgi:hypothetical protein